MAKDIFQRVADEARPPAVLARRMRASLRQYEEMIIP